MTCFLERLLGILANSNTNYRSYNFQAFANIFRLFLFLFLLKFTLLDLFTIFITAYHKASFASGVYRYGRHIRLSVRLSVTLRYYVKTRGRRRYSLYHWVAQCLRYSDAKNG